MEKTRAQYYREYRAKKKAQIAKAFSDVLKRRKIAAERQRIYRARKKAEKLKQADTSAEQSTIVNSSTSNVKRKKSSAERQREYRARRKAKYGNILNNSSTVQPVIDHSPSTNGVTFSNKSRRRKSAAEYQREYRKRLKSRRNNNSFNSTTDGLAASGKSFSTITERTDRTNRNIKDTNGDVPRNENIDETRTDHDTQSSPRLRYSQSHQLKNARNYNGKKIVENALGFACLICDRLWFKQDLEQLPANVDRELFNMILADVTAKNGKSCTTCLKSMTMRNSFDKKTNVRSMRSARKN